MESSSLFSMILIAINAIAIIVIIDTIPATIPTAIPILRITLLLILFSIQFIPLSIIVI